jgi:hypothetical protein
LNGRGRSETKEERKRERKREEVVGIGLKMHCWEGSLHVRDSQAQPCHVIQQPTRTTLNAYKFNSLPFLFFIPFFSPSS